MENDWYWEPGDKFTHKVSSHNPPKVYEVVAVTDWGLRYLTEAGNFAIAVPSSVEPYISPKLRKRMEMVLPWAEDPVLKLHSDITKHIDDVQYEALDNEDATCEERALIKRGLELLAERKVDDTVHLAKHLLKVMNLAYRRI